MTTTRTARLAAGLLFSLIPLASNAQHKAPTDAQCKQMTEHMLGVMKAMPKQVEKEKERKDALVLYERAEKIVKEGRAKGATECETWSVINKLIVNQ